MIIIKNVDLKIEINSSIKDKIKNELIKNEILKVIDKYKATVELNYNTSIKR